MSEESAAVCTGMGLAMRTPIDLGSREPAGPTSFLIITRVEDQAPLSGQQSATMPFLLVVGGSSHTMVSLLDAGPAPSTGRPSSAGYRRG